MFMPVITLQQKSTALDEATKFVGEQVQAACDGEHVIYARTGSFGPHEIKVIVPSTHLVYIYSTVVKILPGNVAAFSSMLGHFGLGPHKEGKLMTQKEFEAHWHEQLESIACDFEKQVQRWIEELKGAHNAA